MIKVYQTVETRAMHNPFRVIYLMYLKETTR